MPEVIYRIQPLEDPRWASFVNAHPHSSVFHTAPWLDALRRTYSYVPLAYTVSPPQADLRDAVVVCRVSSWITGRRLVSLPFSDHCEPLLEDAEVARALVSAVRLMLDAEKLRYVEFRAAQPLTGADGFYRSTLSYCFHQIDLRPDLAVLFGNFHKSSTQRKILRAEREGLVYESGRSPDLLGAFWRLFRMTRRRHHAPPQPVAWFCNLIHCFGPALQIRVAFKERQPVAAILTLRHKDTLVYKYGGSDPRFTNLGGTHLLFWRSIQQAKAEGLRVFDLGRTDWDNTGLITFKDRWGSTRSSLTYTRFLGSPRSDTFKRLDQRLAKRVVSWLPDCVLGTVGSVFYRHCG